jgi:uncharacterized protein DUF4331
MPLGAELLPVGDGRFATRRSPTSLAAARSTSVRDLLYGGNLSEVGQDTLSGFNVNTIAIQVPNTQLALKGDATRNPVIGVWSDTDRQSMRLTPGKEQPFGQWVQDVDPKRFAPSEMLRLNTSIPPAATPTGSVPSPMTCRASRTGAG